MDTRCPVLWGCLTVLSRNKTELYPDLDIPSLAERVRAAPQVDSYSRLRGFILVESLLAHVKTTYQNYRTACTPELSLEIKKRDWDHLTGLLKELKDLASDAEIDSAEGILFGIQILNEGSDSETVVTPGRTKSLGDIARGVHMRYTRDLLKECEIASAAITTLRRSLSGNHMYLNRLPGNLWRILQIKYGVSAFHCMYELASDLTRVRL